MSKLHGVLSRLRNRLILMRHPNYRALKRHLVGVWSGK